VALRIPSKHKICFDKFITQFICQGIITEGEYSAEEATSKQLN